jgi:hypothetical protein
VHDKEGYHSLRFFGNRSVGRNTLVVRGLCAQRPEKLPHVVHRRTGLFPEGKMAAFGQLPEAHKIEISLEHTLGRFETQHLTGRINDASWRIAAPDQSSAATISRP